MDGEQRAWVIGGVLLTLIIGMVVVGVTYDHVNYDNKRMQFGYCEMFEKGNPQRLLVKCTSIGGQR